MANTLADLIRPRRNLGFAGQEGEMLNMLSMAPEDQMQPINTIRTSSGEYITPGGGRSMQPVEFGGVQQPQFRGSPVDVFGQGKGYMQPDGTIIGVNQQGQRFAVNPAGTAAAGQAAKDAELKRRMMLAQVAAEEARARGETPGAKPQQLSATAQKELFESDEVAQAATNAMGMLQEALNLNPKAYSGYGAKERAIMRSNLPGESEEANATINLDNLMTGQALESLKATFGGMPTEGERKILLDMQASADKTPKQRELILKRAIDAADRRIKFNQEKAQALRSGTYFNQPVQFAETSPQMPRQAASQDAEAVAWARANPNDPRAARILQLAGGQ